MGIVAPIEALWAEFQSLTPHQKRVVFSMYWEGYTEAETAETMGINQSSVHRALASAEKKIKKNFESSALKVGQKGLVHVEAENREAERGNGLVTTQAQNAHKAPASNGPPASACPPPDIYLGSPARDAFIKELSWCAASPFLQLQDRGGYNRRARANRERLARDRETDRAERMALQAA